MNNVHIYTQCIYYQAVYHTGEMNKIKAEIFMIIYIICRNVLACTIGVCKVHLLCQYQGSRDS